MLDIGQHRLFSNSKDLLDTLSSRSQYVYNIFKTCDFSTLYTTIPHMLLKSRIKELIQRCFLEGLLKYKDRKLAQTFNSSFRYIDDVLPLNNSRFGDYLHRIYPMSLKLRILLILKSMLLTLNLTLKSTMEEDKKQNSTTNAIS